MLRAMPRLKKISLGARYIVRATTQPDKEWIFKVNEIMTEGADVPCFTAIMEGDNPQIVAFDVYGIAVVEPPDATPVGYYIATEPPPPEGYGFADAVPLMAK